jgi:hypothetical protein
MDHEKDGPSRKKPRPLGQSKWWWHSLISRGWCSSTLCIWPP